MTMLRFDTARRAAPLMLVAAFALASAMSASTASGAPAPGQEESAAEDPEAIRPFTIDVSDDVLADLKDRLSRTRLPDEASRHRGGTTGPTASTWRSCSPTGGTSSSGGTRSGC